jgi:hypothetical protein
MATKGGGEVPEMSLEEWEKTFMSMKEMVEALYYKNQPHGDEVSSVKGGDGGGPIEPSSPSFGNGAIGKFSKKSSPTHNELPSHKLLLKLDVKFELLVYDGELNADKLDN